MSTFSLELLFIPNDKKSDLPWPPIAHIYVKSHSKHEYEGQENKILITHRCMSFPEIREEIRRLRHELDELEKKARSKFRSIGSR